MSDTLRRIVQLAQRGKIRISEHGYDGIAEEGLFVRDIVADVPNGRLVEDYPDFPKGPCVLVLQQDRDGNPIHVVWGDSEGTNISGRDCNSLPAGFKTMDK